MIDCDFMKPAQYKIFERIIDKEMNGYRSIQYNEKTHLWELFLSKPVENHINSFINRLKQMIEYYRSEFDYLILDSSPTKASSDAEVLMDIVDCTLMVVKEDYSDIVPAFPPGNRLKISAFKVDYTGEKLGQRFLRIIFMQALEKRVDEIYVTIVNRSATRRRLINLLEYWGFKFYGIKEKREEVYVRSMKKETGGSPFFYYPYQSLHKPIFVIPLGYNYSHELLPDSSILNKTSDVEPYKAAIRKTIVFQNMPLKIKTGYNLLFYQINRFSFGRIIASGVVCSVKRNFPNETSFIRYCSKRSILTLNMLTDLWARSQNLTVIDFLYNNSFEAKEITDETLQNADIDISALKQNQVLEINSNQFAQIIKGSFYEENIITDKTSLC